MPERAVGAGISVREPSETSQGSCVAAGGDRACAGAEF